MGGAERELRVSAGGFLCSCRKGPEPSCGAGARWTELHSSVGGTASRNTAVSSTTSHPHFSADAFAGLAGDLGPVTPAHPPSPGHCCHLQAPFFFLSWPEAPVPP